MNDQDEWQRADLRDRREIAQSIEWQVAIQTMVDRHDSGRREKQRVTVAGGFCDRLSAYVSSRTGTIVDDHLLTPRLAQLLCDDARSDIGRSCRRERHDQTNRLGRVALPVHRKREEHKSSAAQARKRVDRKHGELLFRLLS